ncbi:unnamed protein product [Didymodactylos carnosus]|uniref:Uncharacterized protein n=1 Tax=Didymodactylos carnosus TaxID=1234261 RepID=A0A815H5F8_9BILA|nr:unnamed protein product [Didymodactylos carnosus]CAF4214278.1 unnamed protein product [Didymodactylos carnosus]
MQSVSQFRSQQTSSGLKLTYCCSLYEKYPGCDFQIQATIDDLKQISVNTFKQHNHDDRAASSRVTSPVREIVKESVARKLTKSQIRLTVQNEHSEAVPSSQLTSLLTVSVDCIIGHYLVLPFIRPMIFWTSIDLHP